MTSLKAVLVQDYGGNNILSVLSDDTVTNPTLISGMLSAIDSFSRELMGGGLGNFESANGIKLMFNHFYVEPKVCSYNLVCNSSFNFNDVVVDAGFEGLEGNYFYADSIPEWLIKDKELKHKIFSEEVSKLGFDRRRILFLNHDDRLIVNSVVYIPHITYVPCIEGSYDQGVYYCMIYDKGDEELEDLVSIEFSNLTRVLKDDSVLFGPYLKDGCSILLNQIMWPKLKSFVEGYNKHREELAVKHLFEKVPANLPRVKEDAEFTNNMKENVQQLKKLFNGLLKKKF